MSFYDDPDTMSPNDQLREFASAAGEMNQDQAWLLHDRDIWVANPYYTGPEVPHPESTYYEELPEGEWII